MADPSALSVTGHGDTVGDASVVSSGEAHNAGTKVTLPNDLQGIDVSTSSHNCNLVVVGER
jgi:hypothetical protein